MSKIFHYMLGLRLVNPSPKYNLTDQSFTETIYNAAATYNHICSTAKNNPKEISIHEIHEKSIILTLSTQVELTTPGKALRSFSQILLQDSSFSEAFLFGKQLFTSFNVTADINSESQSTHITAADIDDTLFLNSLINYFLNKRDPDTTLYLHKRKAIERMKLIAYESKIVKLDD